MIRVFLVYTYMLKCDYGNNEPLGRELQSITQLNVSNMWYILDQQKTTCFGR